MTIKQFAQLCACTTQTLRYYDKIGLLKPAQVDPWTGYRHYDPAQAIAFVKIKNLQAADFSIQEIMQLLTQSNAQVYAAFQDKIAEQSQKLERIKEIQQTYLSEKNAMEQIVYSMTDYILSQCTQPEVLTEFGMSPEDAPAILTLVRDYMNSTLRQDVPPEQVSLTINDERIQGHEAVLDRIQGLSKENLGDTILLNDGFGHSVEHTSEPEPNLSDYETLFELQDWAHVYDFIDRIPPLEEGKTYCLWLRSNDPTYFDDLSFPMFLLGTVLYNQKPGNVVINCAVSATDKERENLFKLLVKT